MKKKTIYSLVYVLVGISHLSSLSKQHTPAPAYTLQGYLCAVIALLAKKNNLQKHIPTDIQKIMVDYCISQQGKTFNELQKSRAIEDQVYSQKFVILPPKRSIESINAYNLKEISFFGYSHPELKLCIHHGNNLIINIYRTQLSELTLHSGSIKSITIIKSIISTLKIGCSPKKNKPSSPHLQSQNIYSFRKVPDNTKSIHLDGPLTIMDTTLDRLSANIEKMPSEENVYFIPLVLKNNSIKKPIYLEGKVRYAISADSLPRIYTTPRVQLFPLTNTHLDHPSSLCCFFLHTYFDECDCCCIGISCFPICMPLHCCCLMGKEKQYRQLIKNACTENISGDRKKITTVKKTSNNL